MQQSDLVGATAIWSHPHDVLRYALNQLQVPGLVCEFGVAGGTTLSIIVNAVPNRRVVGFDGFAGLPEDWRPGFPAGTFAQQSPPQIPGAELQIGMFADTLPTFLAGTDEPIAFIHMDCDLYSSTATVLDLVYPRLADGAIIVFDEFFNYPGWQEHECRAWEEFVGAKRISFDYLAYAANCEQVAVQVTSLAIPEVV